MQTRLPEYGWQAHTNGTMKLLFGSDHSRFLTPNGRRFFLLLHVEHVSTVWASSRNSDANT